jgi:hypothetical protein
MVLFVFYSQVAVINVCFSWSSSILLGCTPYMLDNGKLGQNL